VLRGQEEDVFHEEFQTLCENFCIYVTFGGIAYCKCDCDQSIRFKIVCINDSELLLKVIEVPLLEKYENLQGLNGNMIR